MNLGLARLAHAGGAAATAPSVRPHSRALVRSSGRRCCEGPASGAARAHPGHAIWKRDFTGACGLFSIVLKPVPEKAVLAFLNALTLFGIGASWGGFESLAIPVRRGALSHRDEMGAGRPDGPLPHRARGRRRSDRRSRARLRGAGRGEIAFADVEALRHRDDGRARAVARDPGQAGVLRRGDERLPRPHRRAQSQGQRHRLAAGPRRSPRAGQGARRASLRAAKFAAGCTAFPRRSRT